MNFAHVTCGTILAAGTILLASLLASPASAWVQNTTGESGDGLPLFWHEQHIDYVIDQDVIDAMGTRGIEAIYEAAAEWGRVSGVPEIRVYLPGELEDEDKVADSIKWMHDMPAKLQRPAGTIAITTSTWHSDGSLRSAPISINADAEWEAYPDYIDIYAIDLQSAMVHEFGHALGLEHSDKPGAVMSAYLPRGDLSRRQLTSDDVEGVLAVQDYAARHATAQALKTREPRYIYTCDATDIGVSSTISGKTVALLFVLFLIVRRKVA